MNHPLREIKSTAFAERFGVGLSSGVIFLVGVGNFTYLDHPRATLMWTLLFGMIGQICGVGAKALLWKKQYKVDTLWERYGLGGVSAMIFLFTVGQSFFSSHPFLCIAGGFLAFLIGYLALIGLKAMLFEREYGFSRRPLPSELNGFRVIAYGQAQAVAGLDVRFGYLYLSDAGFLFKPVDQRSRDDFLAYPRKSVKGVGRSLAADTFLAKGLLLELQSGETASFRVENVQEWLKASYEKPPRSMPRPPGRRVA
jgi:hypothetical protein